MENKKRLTDVNPIIRNLTAMKSMYDDISIDGMIKALEEAPAVYAADFLREQWISVKDRLPEEDEKCIFFASGNNAAHIGQYVYTGRDGAVKFKKRDGRGTVLYTASHWMPLPELPEVDKP